MLHDVYIIDKNEEVIEEAVLGTDYMPLHVIDLNDKKKLFVLVDYYYQQSLSQKFGIALKNVKASNAESLSDIMVLVAHPNYIGSTGKMKVFLIEALSESRNIVERFLKAQGYHEIEILQLDKECIAAHSNFSINKSQGYIVHCTDRSEFQLLYQSYLEQAYNPNAFLVINEEVHFKDTYAFLQEIDKTFHSSNPYLYSLLKELYKIEKQNQYLITLAALRERQLKTFQKLFEENSKNSEIDYILNFYYKEYEVLPLWFKRLGHIVKAATGKRSWRSLTGNNDS